MVELQSLLTFEVAKLHFSTCQIHNRENTGDDKIVQNICVRPIYHHIPHEALFTQSVTESSCKSTRFRREETSERTLDTYPGFEVRVGALVHFARNTGSHSRTDRHGCDVRSLLAQPA